MRTARNFGGAFALGIHTIQQLWSVYGQHEGDTIASLGRPQLYLTQPDYRSAEWCSAMIGKSEYRETERSTTVGVECIRDGVGWTQKTEYRPIALPEQIMGLPSLKGYIKFPEGYPTALINIAYRAHPKQSEGFISPQDLGITVGIERLTDVDTEEKPDESEDRVRRPATTPQAPEKEEPTSQRETAGVKPKSRVPDTAVAATVKGVAAKPRAGASKDGFGKAAAEKAEAQSGKERGAKGNRPKGKGKGRFDAAPETPTDGPTLERRMGPDVDYPRDDLEMGDE
jgi:hypothetical protein